MKTETPFGNEAKEAKSEAGKDTPPLPAAIQTLRETDGRLSDAIGELEAQLAPICGTAPNSKPDPGDDKDKRQTSKITQELENLNESISKKIERLFVLRGLLEI